MYSTKETFGASRSEKNIIEFVFEEDGMVEEQELESYGESLEILEPLKESTSFNRGSNQIQPFSWDKNTTKLLVEQYMSLKDAFRDPKVKKKKLWAQIKNTFLSKCHHVTEDILDRKWRNMKKTYTGIKDNIRKTGRGRIYWEYYDQFNDIYREDKTVNLLATISTSTPVSVIQKLPRNLQPLNEAGPSMDPPQPSVPVTPQKEATSLTPSSNKIESKSGMFYLRRRLAAIGEARVEEIKLLRNALEKSNAFQEERNKILKELCEAQKKGYKF